jgi:UDP-glucose 4-epimerase
MPLIASVALGRMEAIRVCGNQFPTRDGSGSRDFVHVMDVARAIVRSLGQFETEAEEGYSGIRVGLAREMPLNMCHLTGLQLGAGP